MSRKSRNLGSLAPIAKGPSSQNERHQTALRHLRRAARTLNLVVIWQRIESLISNPRNARTHSPKQINQIAASIGEFGFTVPVLVDAEGTILAGHGRIEAAKLLGMKRVPTIQLDHLSQTQQRAYVIADNRLAELAGWDNELLAIEFQGLTEIDLDFEVEITGFETAEIDLLIEGLASEDSFDEADSIPELDQRQPPIARIGDLWLLGPHRLLCGNALDPTAYDVLMAGEGAQLIFTDPPYNVPIKGHVCGSGGIKHPEFIMGSGEMTAAEHTDFLTAAFAHLASNSMDGSIHYVTMDWRHLREILIAGTQAYSELKQLCIWNKTNAGMGSFYRSQHELVFVFKSGTAPHINNFGLGEHGRYRTNVWDYAGVNTLKPDRLDELEMHPTVKPVALVADAIKDCSKHGGLVLDAFAGSGTTIIAAEKTGRVARALELDPHYIDVAVRRWEEFTDKAGRHVETGLSLDELALVRNAPAPETTA